MTPEGNTYESVTTCLGRHGKEEIEKWKVAVGADVAARISKQASTRGTLMHENIEKYLMNEQVVIPKTDYVSQSLFKPFSKTLLENVDNIRAMEYPLYSDTLKLAGTLDLFADWKNVPSIIDFKSSTKIKDKYEIENYFLQCSIYAYMIHERYDIKVQQIVILIGVEFSNRTHVYVENRANFREKLIKLIKGE